MSLSSKTFLAWGLDWALQKCSYLLKFTLETICLTKRENLLHCFGVGFPVHLGFEVKRMRQRAPVLLSLCGGVAFLILCFLYCVCGLRYSSFVLRFLVMFLGHRH